MGPIFVGDQCSKCMVVLRDFPCNSALLGLVSYNDPSDFLRRRFMTYQDFDKCLAGQSGWFLFFAGFT